ncbi:hypothetical protein D3C81_1786330 [compost metagenome]
MELDGEAAGLVFFQPVVGVEALADLQDRFADLAMLRGQVGCCGCDLAHAVFFRCLAAVLYDSLKMLSMRRALMRSPLWLSFTDVCFQKPPDHLRQFLGCDPGAIGIGDHRRLKAVATHRRGGDAGSKGAVEFVYLGAAPTIA